MYLLINGRGLIKYVSDMAVETGDGIKISPTLTIADSTFMIVEVEDDINIVADKYFYINEEYVENPNYIDPKAKADAVNERLTAVENIVEKKIENMDDETLRSYLRERNNETFAKYLDEHPLTWVDGNVYGVTKDDQLEITSNLTKYNLDLQLGIENPRLEWHEKGKKCTPWTVENLSALASAIGDYVYPYYSKCQEYKEQIIAATTREELLAIAFDYEITVEE